MNLKNINGNIQAGDSAVDHLLDTKPLIGPHLFHGDKTALKNLDSRETRNRFLYTTPNMEMAKQYGEVITPIYLVEDAKVEDLSDPKILYGDIAAFTAIADYAEQNKLDSDALLESI